jgi:DNA-directed RNA polymerase subunit RPC12/RpoP
MKCPNCNKKIDEPKLKKDWHKLGRSAKCPKCGKLIIFYKTARGLIPDKDGILKKRFRHA